MEPTKFEEHSREKFEERTLQPSPQAWLKLEKMLDATAPAKKKTKVTWYAIAASFIGLVLIASFLFNNTSGITTPNLVDESLPPETLKKQENVTEQPKRYNAIDTPKSNTQISLEKNNTVQSKTSTNKNIKTLVTSNAPVKNTKELAQTVQEKAKSNKQTTHFNQSNEASTLKFQNTNSALAKNETRVKTSNGLAISEKETLINNPQIKEIKSQSTGVAKVDIDALLNSVQEELANSKAITTEKVDAMALLGDVELDMEKTIRDRLFYALGEGLEYVKTTIVDREN